MVRRPHLRITNETSVSPFYYTVYQGLTNGPSNSTIDLELFLSYPRKFFSVVEQRNPRPGELRIFKRYV